MAKKRCQRRGQHPQTRRRALGGSLHRRLYHAGFVPLSLREKFFEAHRCFFSIKHFVPPFHRSEWVKGLNEGRRERQPTAKKVPGRKDGCPIIVVF